MKNSRLVKFSLIVSLLGILLLIFLSIYSEPKQISIDKINEKQLDNYIKINGTIVNINKIKSDQGYFIIIRLKDFSGLIDILDYQNTNLKINQQIQVIGKVSEYKNQLQVESKKIKIL